MAAPIKLTRQEIYDLVWSEPATKIGRKLDVSDVAIAKVCKKLDVPRPPREYWARRRYGYVTEKPSLPSPSADTPLEHWLNPPDEPKLVKPAIAPPQVNVSEQLQRPHCAVKAIRGELKGCNVDDFGRIGRSDGPVHVTKATYSRACRILDALFKILEARGHSVIHRDGKICLTVNSETIHLAVSEPTRRIELDRDKWGYRQWEFMPTRKLVLTLSARQLKGVRKQWSDGKVQQVDSLLGRLVVTIERAPLAIKAVREEEERRAQEWQCKQLRMRRERDVIRLTHERADAVDKLAADYRKAAQIREFLAVAKSEEAAGASILRRASWAKQYADHIDPLVDFRLDVLDRQPPRYNF